VSNTPVKNKKKRRKEKFAPSKIKSLEKKPEEKGKPHKHNKQTKIAKDKKGIENIKPPLLRKS
jgi:hypothetical protein